MSRQIDSSLFSFIYIKDIEHSVSDVSSWIASDEFGYFFRNSGRVGIGYHKDGVPPFGLPTTSTSQPKSL